MKGRIAATSARERIAEQLELPKDIILGASIITMVGNRELRIENYKGLIDFTEDCILLQGKHGRILVKGKKLNIEYYTNEDMKIYGLITEIQYQ